MKLLIRWVKDSWILAVRRLQPSAKYKTGKSQMVIHGWGGVPGGGCFWVINFLFLDLGAGCMGVFSL